MKRWVIIDGIPQFVECEVKSETDSDITELIEYIGEVISHFDEDEPIREEGQELINRHKGD